MVHDGYQMVDHGEWWLKTPWHVKWIVGSLCFVAQLEMAPEIAVEVAAPSKALRKWRSFCWQCLGFKLSIELRRSDGRVAWKFQKLRVAAAIPRSTDVLLS